MLTGCSAGLADFSSAGLGLSALLSLVATIATSLISFFASKSVTETKSWKEASESIFSVTFCFLSQPAISLSKLSRLVGLSLKYNSPFAVTVNNFANSLDLNATEELAFGTFTWIFPWEMKDAVISTIASSTNIISMNGIMLISSNFFTGYSLSCSSFLCC
ncbi:hypothetical protein CF65_01125 [Aggregatibacter actinomycetemcomitans HK1651]|nr:hypothetical protein CF65_01125 [Aggregatibacter actinomycetemcomitans HK1651]